MSAGKEQLNLEGDIAASFLPRVVDHDRFHDPPSSPFFFFSLEKRDQSRFQNSTVASDRNSTINENDLALQRRTDGRSFHVKRHPSRAIKLTRYKHPRPYSDKAISFPPGGHHVDFRGKSEITGISSCNCNMCSFLSRRNFTCRLTTFPQATCSISYFYLCLIYFFLFFH